MAERLVLDSALVWDVIWQPALWLLAGTLASLLWRHRPARAHRALMLAMAAALLTPLLSQLVRTLDWGLFARPAPTPVAAGVAGPQQRTATASKSFEFLPDVLKQFKAAPANAAAVESARPVTEAPSTVANPPGVAEVLAVLAIGLWAGVTALLLFRLLLVLARGLRLLSLSHPVHDPALLAALREAVAKLGLRTAPTLYGSAGTRSPVIWCWGRRPILLLPPQAGVPRPIDWVAVLCHELAHWKRRDHLACLLGELLTALLPWQPLAWIAKRRLGQLAERACDDWVLASGRCPLSYAESLLSLLPQRRRLAMLAAVSGRRGLMARITHILAPRGHNPVAGWVWSFLALSMVIGLVTVLALVQERQGRAREKVADSWSGEAHPGKPRILAGRVHGPDGKPAAGVAVAVLPRLVFWTEPGAMVMFDPRYDTLGATTTDREGHFRVNLSIPSGSSPFAVTVLASGGGYGMSWAAADPEASNDLALALKPEHEYRARLLTATGQPAARAEVRVLGVQEKGVSPSDGIQLQELNGDFPWWPQPVSTDDQGYLRLPRLAPGQIATVQVRGAGIGTQEVKLPAALEEGMADVRLEPARVLRGRVLQSDTHRPVRHARLTVYPDPRRRALRRAVCETVADAEGRFELTPLPVDFYHVVAEAPAGEPYHGLRKEIRCEPQKQVSEVQFELPRGRLVQGVVREGPDAKPAADAVVIYWAQPEQNPAVGADPSAFQFTGLDRHLIHTDSQGRFSLVVLPGPGHLEIGTPNPHAISDKISCGQLLKGQPGGMRLYAPCWVRLDVQPGDDPIVVSPRIRFGVSLRGKVVGPDGKEVARAKLWCRPGLFPYAMASQSMCPFEVRDGRFEVTGCTPGENYRAMVYDPEHDWGTCVDLVASPSDDEPVLISLQPCARAHARFSQTDGTPCENYRPELRGVLIPGVAYTEDLCGTGIYCADIFPYYKSEPDSLSPRTNPDGRCTFTGLIPGATYWVTMGDNWLTSFTVEAGQTLELPDIHLPERPKNATSGL